MLIFSLILLAISTALGLVPLYGTKIVFDNVLGGRPLPPRLTGIVPLPADPRKLLGVVSIIMVSISITTELFGLWSRWQSPADQASTGFSGFTAGPFKTRPSTS